jgi:SNF2 family DNA or RNA helicase
MNTLESAIKFLAAMNPDLTSERNDIGPNALDTPLVMKLATMSETQWSPRQKRAAWKLLGKYRHTQLAPAGIDYDAIPEPPAAPQNGRARSITTDGKQRFTIRFDYDANLVAAVKADIPGRKFDGATKTWSAPATAQTIEPLLKFAAAHDFDMSDEAMTMCDSLIAQREERLEMSRAHEAEIEVAGLGGELRPFQKAGVAYMLGVKRGFVCDEMGLGKTVEALATIQAANAFPAIVVCPASLKLNWKRESEKWLPGRSVSVWNGKPGASDADVIVINYDVLAKHVEALKAVNPRAVIFDESHYAKNYKAKRTEAAKELAKGVEYRIALTGTPVLNRPQELISQLGIIGRLNDVGGDFWTFAKRYCGAYRDRFGWNMSGAAHLDELNERMRATCYIRRNKADVLKELPAKQRATVPVAISNRREYERAESQLVSWLGEQAEQDTAFLASIAGLNADEQKHAKAERRESKEQSARQAEQLVRIEALKQLSARGKLDAVTEWVESFLETGEKLVVFAHHIEIVEALAEKFSAPSITGSTPVEKRQEYVDSFQADDATRLIVCNIRAGGVGLTLTAASNVAFVELDWTPAAHDQAEDRTHRIGQTDNVTAWYLLGEQTIDEEIAALIEKKRAVVDAATEGDVDAERGGILRDLVGKLMEKK